MRIWFLIVAILFLGSASLAQDKERQFDFWIGEWDVNLKMIQKDDSWKDSVRAKAKVYSVLDGKAILELWSGGEDGILGYSLRNYNADKKRWDLWLNWPAKNRSGISLFGGNFHHGRGEFFSKQVSGERERISRYTFSDITKDSLRWDDGYSLDGGRTWRSNWIMEFTRTAQKPDAIGDKKNLHTYFSGKRCDLPEFKVLEEAVSKHKNSKERRVYRVLDGCMYLGFEKEWGFFTLTYNTYAKVYEMSFLNKTNKSLKLLYGDLSGEKLILFTRDRMTSARVSLNQGISELVLTVAAPGKPQ